MDDFANFYNDLLNQLAKSHCVSQEIIVPVSSLTVHVTIYTDPIDGAGYADAGIYGLYSVVDGSWQYYGGGVFKTNDPAAINSCGHFDRMGMTPVGTLEITRDSR